MEEGEESEGERNTSKLKNGRGRGGVPNALPSIERGGIGNRRKGRKGKERGIRVM